MKLTSIWFLFLLEIFSFSRAQVTTSQEDEHFFYIQTISKNQHTIFTNVKPVKFTIVSKDHIVEIQFNASQTTGYMNSNVYSPKVFGILFMGNDDAILHVAVDQASEQPLVELFKADHKISFKKDGDTVQYKLIEGDTSSWAGIISIPEEYFPKNASKLAAYTNFTQDLSVPSEMVVLTLQNNSEQDEQLPNLFNKFYFQEANLNAYIPNLKFDSWSDLWQMYPPSIDYYWDTPTRSANVVEQGLIGWIMGAGILCSILHVFVLSI